MHQSAKSTHQLLPSVFLRNASGLVRSAGAFDVFTYNLGLSSVGIAVVLVHYWVPANYPGANLPLAEAFGAVAMGLIAWAFWAWSVTIPRSGGIYAFVSRGFNPAIGFAVSFVDSICWLFYNALAATFLTSVALAPLLFAMGIKLGNKNLIAAAIYIQRPVMEFLIGSVAIAVAAFVLMRGMQAFFRLQVALFIAAMVGTGVTIAMLWNASPTKFHNDFINAISPWINDPSLRASTAQAGIFSLKFTIFAAVWPILSFVGSIFSVNIGGEIRQIQKSQAIGMFGSIAVSAVLMILISAPSNAVFGTGFQTQLLALANTNSLPVTPYITVLAAFTSHSITGTVFVCLAFFAWAFFWLPATLIYAARSVLAWSFDRLTPAGWGFVHPQWHTPVTAIVIVGLLNVGFLALFLFAPFFATLVLVLAAMLAWIPTMIGAILFPFTRKELYEQSYLAGKRILGLPVLSVAGGTGLAATCTLVFRLWNDPIAAGHSPQSLLTISALFIIGLGWYFIVHRIRKRQGIDLSRAFRQIPIE